MVVSLTINIKFVSEYSYKINWKQESSLLRIRIRQNSYSPSLAPVSRRHCYYHRLRMRQQLLCNVFTKWTSWADLIIRVDKCHAFGMKKSAAGSIQYLPHIIFQKERERENTTHRIEWIIYLTREAIQLWIKYRKH